MTKSRGITERHGMAGSPIYAVWNTMKSRCGNPANEAFPQYGGRGIKVCARWEKFSGFYADMGDCPAGMTLERVDNSKGYSKENCIWASRTTQGRNKRSNVVVTIGSETLPLSAWAERSGLSYATIHRRITCGWPPADAITVPLVKKRKGIPRGQRIYDPEIASQVRQLEEATR